MCGSRLQSQAKRLLLRIDRFKIVIFDFDGVEIIGRAFLLLMRFFRVFRIYLTLCYRG